MVEAMAALVLCDQLLQQRTVDLLPPVDLRTREG
jgi:hypothetical protein